MPEQENQIIPDRITLESIPNIPLIVEGDHLGRIIGQSLDINDIALQDNDVLVIAQKIISKAEGRMRLLSEYDPTPQAIEIARKTGRNARHVQAILEESEDVRWVMEGTEKSPGIIVVKHRLGHICSGAGIDTSNTGFSDNEHLLLLPENPDKSARNIADYLESDKDVKLGVIVIDTLGDRYRMGSIGKAIGVANVPARIREDGQTDLYGKKGLGSDLAFADSLAGLAMIAMGNPNNGSPIVLIRGTQYPHTPSAKIKDVFA